MDKIKFYNRLIGLVHLVDWKLKESSFNLSDGFRISKYNNSSIQLLFRKLIKKHLIDDDDDTFYCFYIEIDNPFESKYNSPYISAFEYVEIICSLMGICFSGYIDLVYFFDTNNKRDKVQHILSYCSVFRNRDTWLLEKQPFQFSIDQKMKYFLIKSWGNIFPMNEKSNRLLQAIRLYGLACVSSSACEAVLFLVIIWEILFSPPSRSELTHQISMTISRFLSENKKERMSIYKLCKNAYNIRSNIVHGQYKLDKIDFQDLDEAFNLTSKTLYKILSSKKYSLIFLEEAKRKTFLDNLNFR